MRSQTVRTTIDFPTELITQVKIQAAQQGRTLKAVVTDAVKRYIKSDTLPSKEVLLKEFEKLSKAGRQDVDLVKFLRRDRDRDTRV